MPPARADVEIQAEALALRLAGKTLRDAAELIRRKFRLSAAPHASTVKAWAEQAQESLRFVELLDVEENRHLVAERLALLWDLIYEWMSAGEIQLKDGLGALFKVNEQLIRLLGLNAATRVQVEATPPGTDLKMVLAVRESLRRNEIEV